ncbi:hypothetical protein DYU11_30960 [Fibrisoma montanum]|uniref:Uncharacterized protein n=1 Tax=Fibrisoma montanum TaxID=2305895 RepID=A0A418LWN4_9BACT|nr:hypothetical protein DYU11_30960 [Fibrisoma montanum]
MQFGQISHFALSVQDVELAAQCYQNVVRFEMGRQLGFPDYKLNSKGFVHWESGGQYTSTHIRTESWVTFGCYFDKSDYRYLNA